MSEIKDSQEHLQECVILMQMKQIFYSDINDKILHL